MISSLREELATLLPLRILEATFQDYLLTLIGADWNFNSTSPWRVSESGVILYGYSDTGSEDRIWDLCGQDIVSVSHQSMTVKSDPVFQLLTGQSVEIFSDWGNEPWVMQLPHMTFIAAPSDRRYVD